MRLVELAIYPVKSARGIAVPSADIESRGLGGDRRWMFVDENGRFVSQRELPALARLSVRPLGENLALSLDGDEVEVARPAPDAARMPVRVWRDVLHLPEAPAAREWLARRFGRTLLLVFQPDDARRPVEDWAEPDDEVSLADGFPVLVATTASLEAVRDVAGRSIRMERFRPNLVIEGSAAWAEDRWARIRVGAIELDLVKPCARCAVTTVDPERGVFAGKEPIAALRRIRMSVDRRVPGVLFGWNAVPRGLGAIRVGDPVEVVSTREPWPIGKVAAEPV